MAVFCSKQIVVPVRDKMLSDYAEGEIVKLNENGSPVEFYVAKHDYESSLNGNGRTLLVRKDCYIDIYWNLSGGNNTYASSQIDNWINNNYKALLNASIREVINTTKFYYTPGNGNTTVTTLERAIFLLSVTELGGSHSYANVEGTVLPIASTLQIAYKDGSAVNQWTRSPMIDTNSGVYEFYRAGSVATTNVSSKEYCRPCFTLPGTTLFDHSTNLFKG